jgi:hypothetical protein
MTALLAGASVLIARGMEAQHHLLASGIRPILTDLRTIDEARKQYLAGTLVDNPNRLHAHGPHHHSERKRSLPTQSYSPLPYSCSPMRSSASAGRILTAVPPPGASFSSSTVELLTNQRSILYAIGFFSQCAFGASA